MVVVELEAVALVLVFRLADVDISIVEVLFLLDVDN